MNASSLLLSTPRQHLPRGEDFLLFPPAIQPYAYRIVDRLFAHRVIRCGPHTRELPRGEEIAPRYMAGGCEHDVASFMDRNLIAGLLVIRHGKVVLERYGLGLQEHDRWSTMSTVKSMTAMLVGAASATALSRRSMICSRATCRPCAVRLTRA